MQIMVASSSMVPPLGMSTSCGRGHSSKPAEDLVLECVMFPPWGRASAPAGVAPEALEECLHSSKGYIRRPAWLLYWGGRPASFSAGIGIRFSRPQFFSCWRSDSESC